jgi:hypothetical protein
MKTKFIISLLLIIILVSCKKDFLEIAPQTSANAETFYITIADYNAALTGCYATTKDYFNTLIEMTAYRSDELSLISPTAGTQDRYDIDKFVDKPANTIITNAWTLFYNGIERSNEITSRIGNATFSDSLKNRYEGEAKFLRALNYYYIVQFWGNAPIISQPISPSVALTIGRSDISQVYSFIEQDLKNAIQNLPTNYTGADVGRATSGAALALLSKVYLLQKKYTQANELLSSLITQNIYQLQSTTAAVFDVNNKLSKEVIYAVRYYKESSGNGHGLWLSTTDTASATGISKSSINAYSTSDNRRNLLRFTKQGNVFALNKFNDIVSTTTKNAGNDLILLRYADVVLMQAEVLNELGYIANSTAFQALNAIRTRAGLAAYTATTLPDQLSFRNAVYQERRLEFALEMHRWFDLVRTNNAKTQIGLNELITIQDYQTLFPIPSSEIQKYNNPSLFGQNPGYN